MLPSHRRAIADIAVFQTAALCGYLVQCDYCAARDFCTLHIDIDGIVIIFSSNFVRRAYR